MTWFRNWWYRHIDYPQIKQRQNTLSNYYRGVADGIKWAKECIDGDISLASYMSPKLSKSEAEELALWLRKAANDVEAQGRS